jgi:hypothetical protein
MIGSADLLHPSPTPQYSKKLRITFLWDMKLRQFVIKPRRFDSGLFPYCYYVSSKVQHPVYSFTQILSQKKGILSYSTREPQNSHKDIKIYFNDCKVHGFFKIF